ncbi:hypothetical protein LBMAG46_20940 [Planctomycetia bacterium]|nr:hypothetical protein LBMAG46_20940 [Planctomycetia bacterium]
MLMNQHGAVGFRGSLTCHMAGVPEQRSISRFRKQACEVLEFFEWVHRPEAPSGEIESNADYHRKYSQSAYWKEL